MYQYTQVGALVEDYASPARDWFSHHVKVPATRWVRGPSTRLLAFVCALSLSIWLFTAILRPASPTADLQPPVHAHDDTLWSIRADQVKDAFRHAYAGYREHALTHDELTPVSGSHRDRYPIPM